MTERRCEEIQEVLATSGAVALQGDEVGQAHLAECDECYVVLESLLELDEALGGLPTVDASDAVVARTLAAVAADRADRADAGSSNVVALGPLRRARDFAQRHARGIAVAASACFVVLASAQLYRGLEPDAQGILVGAEREPFDEPTSSQWLGTAGDADGIAPSPPRSPAGGRPYEFADRDDGEALREQADLLAGGPAPQPSLDRLPVSRQAGESSRAPSDDAVRANRSSGASVVAIAGRVGVAPNTGKMQRSLRDQAKREAAQRRKETLAKKDASATLGDEITAARRRAERAAIGYVASAGIRESEATRETGGLEGLEEGLRSFDEESPRRREPNLDRLGTPPLPDASVPATSPSADARRLREFDRSVRAIEGVSTQEPRGYWANTYAPGDPTMRWLAARLLDRAGLAPDAAGVDALALASAANAPLQPFDRPTDAALEVVLSADRAALEERGRMLLQVGLQATARQPAGRPPMTIELVLDSRSALAPPSRAAAQALLAAYGRARDDGDHFSLAFAGRSDIERIAGDDFRHGPISLALDAASQPGVARHASGPLADALTSAVSRALRESAGRPLGASAVVLVTDRGFGRETDALAAIAHRAAVEGVFVSVVAVGPAASPRELDRVVLAGQGQRHLLDDLARTDEIVLDELRALSRVVARAVRLRIRLEPGVELVDVLGSERLDTVAVERVREAERAVDVRLSRELGIEADRGEDEDGIQIVIPALYAGDSHVILLDVIARGPGPVAEVRARFKDVAMQRNGTARVSLALPGGVVADGPLQANVLDNRLAHALRGVLEEAGDLVRAGRDGDAIAVIERHRVLLVALRRAGRLGPEARAERDIALLDDYLVVLRTGALDGPRARARLAGSLRLAGYRATQGL